MEAERQKNNASSATMSDQHVKSNTVEEPVRNAPTTKSTQKTPSVYEQDTEEGISLQDYQEFVKQTEVRKFGKKESVLFTLLGIFGETGSLLSELKKKQREQQYPSYAEAVVEEFGDILWYLASLANHLRIPMVEVAQMAHRGSKQALPNVDFTLTELQAHKGTFSGPGISQEFEATLLKLGVAAGTLLQELSENGASISRPTGAGVLSQYLGVLISAANAAEISLNDAARKNQLKVRDRWLQKKAPRMPLFDDGYDEDEQLPRHLEMHFSEKTVGGKLFVVQSCRGIKIGDRLTDNMVETDDYRFHDVFHLAYAAVLGWSPVTRSLFKCKRKSRPMVDEVEDGARAMISEEGISNWIFNHAKGRNFFDGVDSLDYGLLKSVRKMAAGFEVEKCALWQWERAILEGYIVFRQLQKFRSGIVTVDLNDRAIHYRPKL